MRKINVLSLVVALSMGALLFGVWTYGWFCDMNWVLRSLIVQGWCGLTTLLGLICLFLIDGGSSYGFAGHKLYRRTVPTEPSGEAVSVSVFKTSGLLMTILGGGTLAFGLRMLETSKLGTNGFGGQAPSYICGWAAVALGVVLIGFRYNVNLDTAGGWLIQELRVFGLGTFRRAQIKGSAKVRFLEEIDTIRGSLQHNYFLQLVDGSDVYNLSSNATPQAASALAGYLHHKDYEHLICDYTGQQPPEAAEPAKNDPRESLNTLLPRLASICVVLMLLVSYSFWYGVSQEKRVREIEVKLLSDKSRSQASLVEQASKLEGRFGELASTEEARANYEEAIVLLSDVLKDGPDESMKDYPYFRQALLGRARLHMKLKRFEKGLEDAERFRTLYPLDWNYQGRFSGVYYFPKTLFAEAYWRTGELDTALHLLEMHRDPDPALRGLILADLERWAEAEEALKSAKYKGRSHLPEGIEMLEERLKQRPK